jgi:hypothetical protein
MNAEGIVLGAGGLAFVGSFKEAGGFPSNGYAVISGTAVLAFLAATVKGGALEGPVKALAGLMLLAALMRYVPTLTNTARKKKTNG